MADGDDGRFVIGLMTGTVLGTGLAMLFAPKAGSELRTQLSDQAAALANRAQEGARRAAENAGRWAETGKEAVNEWVERGREAVSLGTEEAQPYVREANARSGAGDGSQQS
jgi:gas vesicle protein